MVISKKDVLEELRQKLKNEKYRIEVRKKVIGRFKKQTIYTSIAKIFHCDHCNITYCTFEKVYNFKCSYCNREAQKILVPFFPIGVG